MKDLYWWFCFYMLGALLAILFLVHDLRRLEKGGYLITSESIRRIVMLSLWSWVVVYYRLSIWLADFAVYLYVMIVFHYKKWRNGK